MTIKFTIPIAPRTKKNSQRIVVVKGRRMIIPSELYKQYETRRRVDLVNLLEATCDMLVHYGILQDDKSDIVYSHDGSYVSYDKNNPRTEIEIERRNINDNN